MSSEDGRTFRIATRASELALRQARAVQSALNRLGHEAELVTIRTTGDKKLDEPLNEIGAKGLFTRELEDALAAGKVDCCVHSLKDLPTENPPGLLIAAVLEREDPRDVMVVNDGIVAESLADLPRGSRIGTSSLRRRAQLLAARPDVEVVELRGNVPTRVRKVDEGQVHAAVLAAAGLSRLEVRQRIDFFLEPPEWLPAAGQGAIAIQARADVAETLALLRQLDHAPTAAAVAAERAFLAALQGGCQVPIATLMVSEADGHVLHGLIADPRGRRIVRGEEAVELGDPESAGRRLASRLRAEGGNDILAALRGMEKVSRPQPE